MGDVLAAAGVDEMRDRVVAGRGSGAPSATARQIGLLAGLDRADPALEAERAGAAEGRAAQGRVRRHRLGAPRDRLREQRRRAHLLEQVEAVVARRAVGAEADIDACASSSAPARSRSRA